MLLLKPYWWDEKVEELINMKREAYLGFLATKDSNTREIYRKLNRDVKREVLRKKNNSWMKKCDYVDQFIGGSKNAEAWKVLKSLRTNTRNMFQLKNITMKDWVTYFEELLEETRPQFVHEHKKK